MTQVAPRRRASAEAGGRAPARREVRDDVQAAGAESLRTAAERAYQDLRQRILDGRLPSGLRIKEIEIARDLGISRTPVRDALSRLNSEGLLDVRPNFGATVVVWSEDEIAVMFRIRSMLEPFAAEVAASAITDDEIAELRGLCDRMEEAVRRERGRDLAVLSEANARFHKVIIDASRSERLARLITLAVDAPLTRRIFSRYSSEEIQRSMRHHREILDALSHRDSAWAASAMRTHILSAIGRATSSGHTRI